jgi:hypothetical protein
MALTKASRLQSVLSGELEQALLHKDAVNGMPKECNVANE